MHTPNTIHKLLTSAPHFAFNTVTEADIAGTLVEFRCDGEGWNYAQLKEPLFAASIRFTTDHLGVPARALALPESLVRASLTNPAPGSGG